MASFRAVELFDIAPLPGSKTMPRFLLNLYHKGDATLKSTTVQNNAL